MTLIGNGNVHAVGNVISRVLGAVNVEDRDSMIQELEEDSVAQGSEEKLFFFSPCFIDENDTCTTV